MKFSKLVFRCGLAAVAMAVVSMVPTIPAEAADFEAVWDTLDVQMAEDKGSALEDLLQDILSEEADAEVEDEEEVSPWEGKLLVVIDEDTSLNVRSKASTDAEIVGKIYRGCAAEVVEQGDEWTKIVSGDVEGYIKNEYCLYGEEAEEAAQEICETIATVTEDAVRVRSEASTDSSIYTVAAKGDEWVVVLDSEEEIEGWIQVEYNNTVAYISADYVEVELEIGEAVTMEEIYAQQAAEAAEKAAAEAAAAAAASASTSTTTTKTTTTQSAAVSASTDDVTLLAALIQCEAGNECYEGKLAVGAVVMNRVKSSSYPNSIYKVIYQSGQFGPASSGKLASVISSGNISSSCYQAARAAISGTDNTGGATHFHAGSSGGTVIGNQVFY